MPSLNFTFEHEYVSKGETSFIHTTHLVGVICLSLKYIYFLNLGQTRGVTIPTKRL